MYNLTGVYWIKNEAMYIPEYIEFHLLQGFDHFIFYDNGSTDNLLDILKPYIDENIIEIRYYPDYVKEKKNFWLMDFCINEQKGKTKWLHYHALDERLFCPNGDKITDVLKSYENYGGLSVAWELFNSNNKIEKPNGLVIENYTRTVKDGSYHIKTIIQPEFATMTIGNPHNFHYHNKFSVDENYNRVDGPFNPGNYSFNKIKLHHYVTMSKEEFEIKMNKGLLDHVGSENIRRVESDTQWNYLHNNEALWGFNDELLKYKDIIKEKILNRYENNKEFLKYINH